MCVSAVTDEMIAAGSITTVKEHNGIHVTITDEFGYNVSDNRYHYVTDWDDKTDIQTMSFYRSYSNGELYKSGLTLNLNSNNRYDPILTAKGVGQLTKTEVTAIVNAAMAYQEYEVTDVKEDKYGFISEITFRDKEAIEAEAREAKRLAKSKEMAKQLIH